MDVNGEAEAPAGKGRKADKQKVPFYELFAFADKLDVGLMIVGTVSAVANGLANPLGTVIFGQLINTFGRSDSSNVLHEISKVSLDFLYLAIATGIASFIQVSSWMVTGERQAARIRGLYLKTILRQDIAFFDSETTTGQVIERMSGDTILIQDALGEKVGKFIQLMSTFFGAFIIAFVRGWLLTLVLLPIIPLLVILGWATTTIMSRMSAKGQLAYAEAGNVVEQTVAAIRTVASFTGEKKAIQDYDKNLHTAYASTVQQGLASGMAGGSGSLINYGGYGVAILYGSKLVMDKGYDGGQVINCIMAIVGAGFSLGEATPCLNAFAVGQAAAYKMLETIKRRPRIDAYDTRGLVLEVIRGEIELKDVHFSYPARPDIQIFSGFSLYVPNGKTAALVGQSGSGKSTVISLLERFYDPHSGEVLIDGVDLKKLQLKWIREKIGLVSQEPILFATTIKENILYGKEDASEEEINTAIMLANASKFIDKLPMGLDTMAGEHGTQLSGGQKQRIAIARAILKNPRILLLDEATSALDSVSERIVQDALVKVMLDRTTLVVAHRLTTIRGADMIAVLHQGKIIEQGTHEELIRDPDGAYNQLVCLQEGNSKTGDDHHVKDIDKVDTEGSSDSIDRIMSQKSMSSRRSASYGFSYPIPAHEAKMAGMAAQQRNIDEGGKRPPNVPLRRLAHLNKPEGLLLLMGSVGAGVSGAMAPIFGMLFSSAINTFFEPPNKMKKDSRLWGLMCIGIGVISLLNGPFKSYLFGVAGGRLIQRIRSLSFQKVVHQEISWFDDPKNSSGAVGARLSIDASTIRKLVGDALSQLVYNVSTIIAALVISFTANWILALVILVLVPVMYLQGYLERRYLDQFSADAKVMYEEASQVASDAIGSIRTVASFCAEKKVMDMYQRKCLAPKKQGVRLGLVSGAGYGFSLFALGCVNALSFYVGALLVQHGKATFEQVFKVFFALTISALGLSHSGFMARDFIGARHSIASVFQLIDSKPTIDSSSNEGTTLDYVKGDIEFQHVSFKYSTRPDAQVLTDFSLSIPSEKTVALVGESGCGKSTVISLIERFYNPESGCILLDGVEIKSLKLTWLRQQIGLVGQEPVLFNETIRANIAYGRDEATEDEIVAAAKAANAHNFINALPSGYDTRVGERGTQLSGGQKQRVAIARAILKEPKILLLDEASSALDAESERVVQEALDRVMVKRTTVVVAHRLSTIKGADIIAVVKDGAVAEQGSHDELMNVVDGAYASLVALHAATATTTTPS